MSDTLHIEFSADMPVAAVEVVAPDLRVVARTMLSAGKAKDVVVPSERSFLRVHLPDGRIVTLDDPGNLTRVISRASLSPTTTVATDPKDVGRLVELLTNAGAESGSFDIGSEDFGSGGLPGSLKGAAVSHVRVRRKRKRAAQSRETIRMLKVSSDEPLQLRGGGDVRIIGVFDAYGRSRRGGAELEWKIEKPWTTRPSQLRFTNDDGVVITVTLPASTVTVRVRRERSRNGDELLCVKLRTQAEHADALLSYMHGGDMYAAQALAEWAEQAESMVLRDDSDPYSGLVGAYLLLRLRQFDRMKDWVRQIADRFDFLPDGCIIWAWQKVHTSRGGAAQARDYFLKACTRGLPVYSEGLRLLLDGLCLLGKAGEKEHAQMMTLAKNVLWTSPVMATYELGKRKSSRSSLAVEVTFAH